MIFYKILRGIALAIITIFNKCIIEGEANIPKSGPVVLVGNHISIWDPVYMACVTKRPVHYMAKEELFKKPLIKQLLTALGAFPVKRGKIDRSALRLAAKNLEQSKVLGLFPEGTRSKTGEMGPFLPGASLFALRAGAPIVPMALLGTKKLFFAKSRVRIGQPLTYPEYYEGKIGEEVLQKVTQDCREKIQELLAGDNPIA